MNSSACITDKLGQPGFLQACTNVATSSNATDEPTQTQMAQIHTDAITETPPANVTELPDTATSSDVVLERSESRPTQNQMDAGDTTSEALPVKVTERPDDTFYLVGGSDRSLSESPGCELAPPEAKQVKRKLYRPYDL